MVCCGLGRLLDPNSAPGGASAGAFAVAKDADTDRLIADRRPGNALDSMPGPVRLPYAPRLRRIRLGKHEVLWSGKRDLSNCFYLFEVDSERLQRQVIGPRLPRSWFRDLHKVDADDCDTFEPWLDRDLRGKRLHDGGAADDSFRQLAMAGVLMGEKGAVTAIQEAHTRMLLKAGAITPSTMLNSPFADVTAKTSADVLKI